MDWGGGGSRNWGRVREWGTPQRAWWSAVKLPIGTPQRAWWSAVKLPIEVLQLYHHEVMKFFDFVTGNFCNAMKKKKL